MYQYFETKDKDLKIRTTDKADAAEIVDLIRGLAEYEKMLDDVVVTEEILIRNLFEKKQAEVILAEYKEKAIGYALFFPSFSTFLGKANLFLEDIFVLPGYRGLGAGKAMLGCFAKIAAERDCERVDWTVLKWNTPSIKFYEQMGAYIQEEWALCRMEREAIEALAAKQ